MPEVEPYWLKEAIERQAVPQELRTEKVEDFVKRHNISISKFYYETRKKESQERILRIVLKQAKEECPEILKVLTEKAKIGDIKAIEIYLNSILKLAKHLDIKTDGESLNKMSYEQAKSIFGAGKGSDKSDSAERTDSI